MLTTCDAVHHHSHKHHPYYWADPSFVDPTASFARSLTFSLASPANFPQGLAESLLELFTAYALAQHESRTFTIDDRDWPWGAWEDYFLPLSHSPPTTPLPCPHSANALSISHSTRTFVFGHAFTDSFELPRFAGSKRQKRIFDLAATGLTALWRLQPQLQAIVDSRISALTELGGAGAWTAVHIRRGDFRPQTWAWHKHGIPLEVFVDPAVSLSKGEGRVIVVSDDPMVPEAPQLAGAYKANDVGVGIQGGWGKMAFVGLSVEERRRVGEEFLVQIEVVRRLVERGAVDEGGVVCAAGSAMCRLLAVMVGWEKSVVKERWWDVEGGLGWRGVDW
ncbi:hypothetical protein BDD12DRAFT_806024 [Trichophaea hybrida]|nr:hypothetical protein BDD12DRAFT_806024 [Trichophaea hybrida]